MTMITAKGYAAKQAKATLTPWSFERREPGPHDVQIEILFCGVCHSDLHQVRDEWGGSWFSSFERVDGRRQFARL